MKYARHRSNMRSKRSFKVPKGLLLLVSFLVVIALLFAVLKKSPKNAETVESTQEVQVDVDTELVENDTVTLAIQEIDIYHEGTQLVAGFARRGIEKDAFTHVIVADLPAIDPAIHYYEAWLVKPGVTEFFSTGSMFARQDGKFGLVYEVSINEAPDDIESYTKIIITRELYDGDPSPSPAHMVEGEF